MTDTLLPTPGTRVTVDQHTHPFGSCFLLGDGTVLVSPDPYDKHRGRFLVGFDSGVTGGFLEKDYTNGKVRVI